MEDLHAENYKELLRENFKDTSLKTHSVHGS